MKQYPSITAKIQPIEAYVFDKIDGSNIRAEWGPKKGFWKFGSRKRLLGSDQLCISKAENLIKEKYEEDLSRVFRDQRYSKVVAFFEFSGKNSFAGYHYENDIHDVTLFDVDVYKKGLTFPQEFLKLYGHLETAKLLYHGKINNEFVDLVRHGNLEGMGLEGVVCKTFPKNNKPQPIMFKIKTIVWLNKLKEFCKGDENLFNTLK